MNKSNLIKVNKIIKKYKNVNSNKLKNSYYDAGQFFWGKPKYFLKKLSLFSNDTFFYKINNIENIDVNTLSDIENIKFLAKCIKL
jgi:pseudaminic acid cytidylyltransferase